MELKKIIESFKQKLSEHQAPEFEIYLSREEEVEAEVKDQKNHAFNASESIGVALRIITKDQQLGFAFTTDFSSESIEKTVERALETSRYSHRREFLSLTKPEEKQDEKNDLKDFDPNFCKTSEQVRIRKALEMEKAALSVDSRVNKVRGASYTGSLSETYLVNSWGLEKYYQKTMNVLSLMAVAEEGEESEGVFEFDFSPSLDTLSPEAVGVKAAKKALRYLGGRPGPTLKCPVILDPLVAAEILEVLAPSFYADALLKKKSLFEGMQAKQVLSPQISLIDDGRLVSGYASFPFDAEGVATQKTLVVEKGIFRNCLADREYGARLGCGSTGSSERESIKIPPQISYSNFYLQPGNLSFEEILKQNSQAIYMTELIGMHTANPISGDFSVGAQGFWVEGGEIRYPLKQMALSGNLKEMLNRVEALGSDLRYYFKLGAPSLLISEMDVAGA